MAVARRRADGATPPGSAPSFAADVTGAYDATGAAWAAGPSRVYDRLAAALVSRSPVPLAGRTVLDVGAGTGAASRAIARAGGRPVPVDRSLGMLLASEARHRSAAVVGDATSLPIADRRVTGVVAAFSFNHLPDPGTAFAEARRVSRRGSPVLAAAYAADDDHPAKAAVSRALTEAGWAPEPWYVDMQARIVGRLATVEAMQTAARAAGLDGYAERMVVELADLTTADLVAWRMGMAQTAPFLATLAPAQRRQVEDRALGLLGADPPPLRRSVIVFAGLA